MEILLLDQSASHEDYVGNLKSLLKEQYSANLKHTKSLDYVVEEINEKKYDALVIEPFATYKNEERLNQYKRVLNEIKSKVKIIFYTSQSQTELEDLGFRENIDYKYYVDKNKSEAFLKILDIIKN